MLMGEIGVMGYFCGGAVHGWGLADLNGVAAPWGR